MIYFDNSATTYPKPKEVLTKTYIAMQNLSFNSGRGGYAQSLAAAERIFEVREKIGSMFSFPPENVVFTKNCTEALNIAIKGSVNRGDHIVISSLEHNSVSRVVQKLTDDGYAQYDVANFSYDDSETVRNFADKIKSNTTLVVCMHSSNAFGVGFPISKIGKLCREKGIRFIVDGAQGVGAADINAERDNIDILCAPGHKCLFGAMGTGFLAVRKGLDVKSFEEGGTGSASLSLKQPEFLPDRLEAGTLNNSGIISIGSGIDFINRVGRDKIYRHEMMIASYIYDALNNNPSAVLYTLPPRLSVDMPIISFNIAGKSSEQVAADLASRGICVRGGYHCTPLAHTHFGTIDSGTVRVSPGYFNTEAECYKFVNVVKNL
ncbi:MAG: aminotransferase class V-fold PLP-dependent enzyme [Oscillospiraceae bacterium]|nr:aminotransferase class V-fold PLP-dependent enzyme [Oscillospiraceae bacterium]